MRIAPVNDAALPAVVALWESCGLNLPHNDPVRDIALLRASANTEIFLGYLGDLLVGTVVATHDGHRGWMYRLAVAPEHRRLGRARALVRHAEAWLRDRGLRKLQVMIRPQHAEAHDFYLQMGYATQDRTLMARWLDTGEIDPGPKSLDVVITHLEMTERPKRPTVPAPPGKLALMRVDSPSVEFCRYLYNSVGEPWFWWERRKMPDDELQRNIGDPKVEVYVLYVQGEPGGYVELDRRPEPTIDFAYFGIFPRFVGRGFGPYLLNWAVDQAWSYGPRRLIVNTCTLDHPKALRTYQKVGFVPYRQERKTIVDPRAAGLIPAHRQPVRS
jgi:GNAT superfamily N-acetyltransferase